MALSKLFSRRAFMAMLMTAALLFSLSGQSARADQSEEAGKFIQGLGDRAISILSDKSVSKEDAAKTFHDMLINSFDIDLLGKFALGPTNWKSATPAQRQEYMKLFEKLVVQIYNDRFSLFNGETWKVTGSKPEDGNDSYVTGLIIKPNPTAKPVKVDWRVRNKSGKPMVIDVIVEGVSMTVSQRSEFASVIQKNGGSLDGFMTTLAERLAERNN